MNATASASAAPALPGSGIANEAAQARAAGRQLAEADDVQVLRVLRLVDSLRERGAADAIVAPLRDRLRALRLERPMRLSRLLFTPLNTVIVDTSHWSVGDPLLPRAALQPLTGIVRDGLGARAEAFERMLAAISTADVRSIQRVGGDFWPQAALMLRAAAMPATWSRQLLADAAFVPLRDAAAFLLGCESQLAELERPPIDPARLERSLDLMLVAARACGQPCWGMLLTILLQRFPEAETPLRAALSPPGQMAGDMAAVALRSATAWIETAAALSEFADLGTAAEQVALRVGLLSRFAREPALQHRAAQLNAALQAGYAAQFGAAVQTHITAQLARVPDPADVVGMEQVARDLRRVEVEARRLGGGNGYDQQLREAADGVMSATGWSRSDRVRMIEILAGPARALHAWRTLPPA